MEESPHMIRSVISDLGKVLIFFDNSLFYDRMARHTSLGRDAVAERVNVFSPLGRAFDLGEISPQEFHAGVLEALQVELDFDMFFSLYNDVFALNRPAVDILGRAARKHRMVLLSNTDVQRFGFIKQRFPEVLFFDEYVLSYEVGHAKPDPAIYEIALDKAKAVGRECVFIDDRPENIRAARNMGIHTVFFTPETDLEAEFRALGMPA
jgi:putative hydrolase of the HAD superfamily